MNCLLVDKTITLHTHLQSYDFFLRNEKKSEKVIKVIGQSSVSNHGH